MNIDQTKLDWIAKQITHRAVASGAKLYNRDRDLPKLIRWKPGNGEGDIIARLENCIRAAKNSARQGHWTYDGHRLMALRQALYAELGYGDSNG